MEYNHTEIDKRWQQYWQENQVYKVTEDPNKPKYYVLDMFPYPSGAGLHVGHPLGYVATDIFSRYKRLQGFNVLHPMGVDAFGLPSEQYALQTGNHPGPFTYKNIEHFKKQLGAIGFDYDWDREVITCDPEYYKWTQWIFLQLFDSWYDNSEQKARPIEELLGLFEKGGSAKVDAACGEIEEFTADEWNAYSEKEKRAVLMQYRLAYQSEADVNWCPELGTVLANDEVQNGFSVRGGHPVIKKPMRQWYLRITAYAQRLLDALDGLNFPESLKEQQRNWIGRSEGATVFFPLDGSDEEIEIFTTRPDTIFGATFMVLAPEHPLVDQITTQEYRGDIDEYIQEVQSISDLDRQADVKKVKGRFTGAYAINPFTEEKIPVWISEYVLMGYGTGAIMAVPADDERDKRFAQKYKIPVIEVVDRSDYPNATTEDKLGKMINSGFLNGMEVLEAIQATIKKLGEMGIGHGKVNYRMRDAGFSRQRYWGEPFPIVYRDDMPYALDEDFLPIELPEVESYQPTGLGQSPLANVRDWVTVSDLGERETDTMPGYAGSSWYFLRYMDPKNPNEFASKEKLDYWQDVDLYVGGSEHAVGHLLYSRFWHKFLHDLGYVPTQEPYKRLVNQGMIQGMSKFVYRISGTNKYVSYNLREEHEVTAIHVDVSMVDGDELNIQLFRNWRPEYADAEFMLEDGKYICGTEVEKMSKSKFNTVNPDEIIQKYGADVFRMYEMFLGPIELHKPWNTQGIDGVAKFMKKFWRLFFTDEGQAVMTDDAPDKDELKILHKTIKKVQEDVERLSFNTCVSAFMICVNELTDKKCHKKAILKELTIIMSAFAPHTTEELWQNVLKQEGSIVHASFPQVNEEYLVESSFEYPVSINGKMRAKVELPNGIDQAAAQEQVLAMEVVQKWTEGKDIRRFIFVPGRIINIVV